MVQGYLCIGLNQAFIFRLPRCWRLCYRYGRIACLHWAWLYFLLVDIVGLDLGKRRQSITIIYTTQSSIGITAVAQCGIIWWELITNKPLLAAGKCSQKLSYGSLAMHFHRKWTITYIEHLFQNENFQNGRWKKSRSRATSTVGWSVNGRRYEVNEYIKWQQRKNKKALTGPCKSFRNG